MKRCKRQLALEPLEIFLHQSSFDKIRIQPIATFSPANNINVCGMMPPAPKTRLKMELGALYDPFNGWLILFRIGKRAFFFEPASALESLTMIFVSQAYLI